MRSPAVIVATEALCELAENPLWDFEKKSVFWTDIPAGKIFKLDTVSKKHELIYRGEPVGGFTLQQNGNLLIFRVNDIAQLSMDGNVVPLRKFLDSGMMRFNDVIAAPDGSVFAGTIGDSKQSGGLYRVDLDGTVTKLFLGTKCSNGMGFSPDLKTFYWTCSTTRQIFQFDYSSQQGLISNRRVFYRTTPDEGIPDGLTVDSEGCVWSARWGGASVVRHAPDGKILDCIRFPVTNITSLCFGGENLDQLFVTAAKNCDQKAAPVIALFQVGLKIRGAGEFRSRIRKNFAPQSKNIPTPRWQNSKKCLP